MIAKLQKLARGFTMIETMVAVLMLSLAIAGPLTIASKGLTATLVAKNQFTAFYLAQDAIEQIRFLRDTACLAAATDSTGCPSASWMQSLNNCITTVSPDGCILDSLSTNPASPTACSGTCAPMRYDPATKVYNYGSSPVTPQNFVRTITISPGSSADEAIVTVSVSWTDIAGVTRVPVTVRENLFRWQ